ncbi:MAG: glycoside hydrolase family 2, partial [Tannerella sp.]|nr:glycoside hydrolase family 2 [Tannerella sp.]
KFSQKISIADSPNSIPVVKDLKWASASYQPKPEDFQDVKVLAFPVNADAMQNLFETKGAKISVSKNVKLAGNNRYQFLDSEEAFVELTLPDARPARSFTLSINNNIFRAGIELQAGDGSGFRTVKKLARVLDRTDNALCRGFLPYSPLTMNFDETTAKTWRVVFGKPGGDATFELSLAQRPVVERYAEKTFAKMFNSMTPPWDAFMWEAQTADATLSINPSEVRDISSNLAADGTLTWDVPEGEWVILRTGMLPTGVQNSPSPAGASGLEVDKINRKHVEFHHEQFIGEVVRRIPPEDRKTFKINVLDSYEKGGQNFTDDFIEIFKQRYGYDPTPFLPAYYGYAVGSPELSDRFLWDMRRLVADRIAHEYIVAMREKSHRDGMTVWLENYGSWGFAGEFLQYGGQTDEIGGEFWLGGYLGSQENRCATSCAHIYGKPKVWAEAFTSGGGHYTLYPGGIKQLGDWAFSEGITAYLLHVYIQQHLNNDYPGIDAWYSVQFNRKNTWFSHLDLFTTYIRRCGHMLEQGLDVADVAYYIGEDAPKMSGITDPPLPAGYHCDFINAEVLLRDASVRDGKLTLPHGTQYRVLVLPPQEDMRPEVLTKIASLVNDGAIVIGSPPRRSPSMENYPQADKDVQALAAKLWGDKPEKTHACGQGKILTNTSMEEVFEMINLPPDFAVDKNAPVLYTHRRNGDTDIYFVTNQSEQRIEISPRFRVTGKRPEFWDAVSGTHRPLPAFIQDDATTAVPLQLEASESAFIVFRSKGAPKSAALADNFPEPRLLAEVTTPWNVQFESDEIKRGPAAPVVFQTLSDLSKNDDPQIKYFSGITVYKTSCKVQTSDLKKERAYIDLGRVGVMAKVKINGTYAGGAWTAPWRVDITDFVKDGDNDIEVETVNTWANRIIGDRQLPEAERKLKISRGPESGLMESGLIGPVKIVAVTE